jgi:hypothetical protein
MFLPQARQLTLELLAIGSIRAFHHPFASLQTCRETLALPSDYAAACIALQGAHGRNAEAIEVAEIVPLPLCRGGSKAATYVDRRR